MRLLDFCHDLRSETAGIVGLASLIETTDSTADARRWGTATLAAARRLEALIEQLESGEVTLDPEQGP